MFWVFRIVALAVVGLVLIGQSVEAQNRFAPVIQVGDSVVTRYQLDQRTRFLALLRAPGDPREFAREQLVNEAIQRRAATDAGIELTPEMIESGMTEFASRANLTAEQFVTALGQNGVDAETFRDFVSAGLAWREYSRARFGEIARDIPRDQIARTFARSGTEGGLRVLVSEILLPATTPETTRVSQERAAELSQLTSASAFSTAARQFSVSASRARGGELNWTALDSLPEEVRGSIAALSPGQATRPIPLENAIGVFFLRNIERAAAGTPENLSVDYALFLGAGSAGEAARIVDEIDTCDDLYGVAEDLPEEQLIREQRPATALPSDIRLAVQTLDLNETALLSRGERPAILMLCGRQEALESEVDFELVGNRLLNERLTVLAANHLAELRANTFIADLAN